MTADHPRQHDARLEELLGEVDPQQAFAASELASCPVCRRELDELLELSARLEASGGDLRRTLREADLEDSAPGAHLVEELVGGPLEERRLRAQQARWSRRLGALAAALAGAAALALGLWLLQPDDAAEGPGDADPGPMLGAGVLAQLAAPLGEVAAFTRFEWRGARAPRGWYELLVYGADGQPVLVRRDVAGLSVEPTEDELARLPGRIRWEVQAFDASGRRVARLEGEAWRPGF
ncbi:MAG: hypothetical protein AAF682_30430 [Planctomycetota bacterium]